MNGLPSRHFYGSTALVGLGPLSMSKFRERIKTHHTHCRTPMETSHGLVAETSTENMQHCFRDGHASAGGIRTRSPSKRAAAHPRVRPRGHRDRPPSITELLKSRRKKMSYKILTENKTLET